MDNSQFCTAWQAGRILRFHSSPGGGRQNIADHTWGMAMIFRHLFPEHWNSDIATWILFHDVPEIATGDVPFPTKRKHPLLVEELDKAEEEFIKEFSLPDIKLSGKEFNLCKIADALELYVYSVHEIGLGNQYALQWKENISHALQFLIDRTASDYSEEIARRITDFLKSVNKNLVVYPTP